MESKIFLREELGREAYEAYRASLATTVDEERPKWEWADHETQLAFREAGAAVFTFLKNRDLPKH